MSQSQRRPAGQRKGARRTSSERLPFEEPRFLAIDLDVRSRRSLAPLARAWSWSYQPLNTAERSDPRWLIVHPRRVVVSAEAAAKQLLRHVGALGGDARRCWEQAHRRTFDIGVQAGGPGRPFDDIRLTAETLARIAAVGARIQVTVYPAESQSFAAPPPHRGRRR